MNLIKQYDIVLMCETWIGKNTTCNLEIPGFQCEHIFGTRSQNAKRGRYSGGIAVYFKKELQNYVQVIEKSAQGFLWLKIKGELFCFDEDVFFCQVYFPDSKSKMKDETGEKVDHLELLENYVLQFQNQGKIFISGDFNCRCGSESNDILSFDKYLDNESDLFFDLPFRQSKDSVIDKRGSNLQLFCQVVDLCIANGRIESGELTYCSKRGQSVVDYLLCDFFDMQLLKDFKILPFNEFSDHAPLLIVFDSKQFMQESIHHKTETLTKVTWDSNRSQTFLCNLQEKRNIISDMCTNIESEGVDKSVQDFTNFINSEVSAVMTKTVKIRKNTQYQNSRNPWFDENCVYARREFIEARNKYLKSKNDANRVLFTQARTRYNHCKRKAKSKYKLNEGKRVCDLAKSKPREFWSNINKHIKSKRQSSDTLTSDDFFVHFQEVFSGGNRENILDPDSNEHDVGAPQQDTDLTDPDLDSEITQDEVRSVVFSLKNSKSPGLDNLAAEVFKTACDLLSPYMVKIFNKIFMSGEYPDSWCKGVIVPIYKNKGDIDSTNNYRGITLSNVLAKTFSHILLKRINKWSDQHDKINNNQFGFQKAKSTVDCIFVLTSIISKVINDSTGNKRLYCAFIDYEKAFDRVDRYLLWYKLMQEDVSPRMLKILKSMYNSVKACIKYNNKKHPTSRKYILSF